MSGTGTMFEVGAVALGCVGAVASWRRTVDPKARGWQTYPKVVIQTAAVSDDGVHEPAQSITVGTREGLIALRSAIDEALKETPPACPG